MLRKFGAYSIIYNYLVYYENACRFVLVSKALR
jgi:hypothetical protein